MNWSWWYLVLLIPLAMLILIVVASFKQRPQIHTNWSWIIGILIFSLVGWSIWWFVHRPKSKETKPTTVTQIIRVGREKHLYLFSDFPDGIIKAEIKLGEVDFYPKGGKIKITPPLPATPWEDEPGTTMPRVKRPPGWYTIAKVNPNATGVEIWN